MVYHVTIFHLGCKWSLRHRPASSRAHTRIVPRTRTWWCRWGGGRSPCGPGQGCHSPRTCRRQGCPTTLRLMCTTRSVSKIMFFFILISGSINLYQFTNLGLFQILPEDTKNNKQYFPESIDEFSKKIYLEEKLKSGKFLSDSSCVTSLLLLWLPGCKGYDKAG